MSQSHLSKTQVAGTKPRAALNLLLIGWKIARDFSSSHKVEQYNSKTKKREFVSTLDHVGSCCLPVITKRFRKILLEKTGTRRLG